MTDKFECFDTPDGQLVLDAIGKASDIVLATHLGPDVDGLACEVALYYGLKSLGKKVHILNSMAYSRGYDYIDPDGLIRTYDETMRPVLNDAELLLAVDVSEPQRLGRVLDDARMAGLRCLALDHHPRTPDSLDGLLDPRFSSASELVYGLFQRMNIPMDARTAFTIYCGIIYDTQMFRYIKNDPQPLRVAADLVEAGADAQRAQQLMYGSRPVDRLRLLARVVDRLHIEKGGRLAWSFVDDMAMKGLQLESDDLRSMVSEILSLKGVMVALFFRPGSPGHTKVSLRSKPPFRVDLAARQFGGGGHQQASGCDLDEDVPQAIERVLTAIRTMF